MYKAKNRNRNQQYPRKNPSPWLCVDGVHYQKKLRNYGGERMCQLLVATRVQKHYNSDPVICHACGSLRKAPTNKQFCASHLADVSCTFFAMTLQHFTLILYHLAIHFFIGSIVCQSLPISSLKFNKIDRNMFRFFLFFNISFIY